MRFRCLLVGFLMGAAATGIADVIEDLIEELLQAYGWTGD